MNKANKAASSEPLLLHAHMVKQG